MQSTHANTSLRGELPGSSRQLLWCQQPPPTPKHLDTSFHIHNYVEEKRNNSSSEALHTCRWWKARRVQQKNPPLCFFPSRWLPPLRCQGQRLSQEAALNSRWYRAPQSLSMAGQRSVRWSNIDTASLFLYPRIHSALACIINAKDWEVWKWISGKDKRDGKSEKRKNNVEGSNTSEHGREKSHGEWRDCVRLAWHLLNISITDRVAIKMLLIQTPKDFYKTSIS